MVMQMPLTEREKQILAAVVSGRTSKEIARLLQLSPKTVSVHRSHILRKMNPKLYRLGAQGHRAQQRQLAMTPRDAHRRASAYARRARELAEQAALENRPSIRRHMLELVAIYRRTADHLESSPAIRRAALPYALVIGWRFQATGRNLRPRFLAT